MRKGRRNGLPKIKLPMVLHKIINILFPIQITPSSLAFKYPTYRNSFSKSPATWLLGKKQDDEAHDLWRIYDCLYDLDDFVKDHPGGSQWLELTKGTDITELFETHHLSEKPERMLSRYFAQKATAPRNSPYTFKNEDFYKTLKRKIVDIYPTLPKWPIRKSKLITDSLLVAYFCLTFLATLKCSFQLGILAGLVLCLTTVASHNFFHQKDNFRMYYFHFSLMSSRTWRVSHVMSHHMYTNTVKDLEISQFEPFLQMLPNEKSLFVRYVSWFYSPIVYILLFFVSSVKDVVEVIQGVQSFTYGALLPFLPPLTIYLLTGIPLLQILTMSLWILLWGSFSFGVVGVNAAHHHPDIFHDGDAPRSREEIDWGVFQIDAVMDRNDITGSHWLVLTHFGDHALHHLFPTIDHGLLQYLYPIFNKTCDEFGIKYRTTSFLDLFYGQFRQLARIRRNKNPPL